MRMYIASIRDRVSDQYGNPFLVVNAGQAIRGFSDEVNRKAEDNQFYKHSEDFDLYHLGFFDTDSGLFETHIPVQVAIGKSIRI